MPAAIIIENMPITRLVLWSSLPLIAIPLTEFLAVSPIGTDAFLFFQLFIFLPAIAAVLSLPITLFLIFFRSKRKTAGKFLFGSVLFLVTCYLGLMIGRSIRMDAFERLAARSSVLVDAIIDYDRDHGEPPNSLDKLVPAYLPKVPNTGMMAYSKYRYLSGEEAKKYKGNPWVLIVFTPRGGINFDQFMYFPLQNYPETGYGGWLRRVRDWAYVHE